MTSIDRGMMGIGTLIIFIAVILIAAVAAAVLISSSGSLQQKALMTSSQTEQGITTGVDVISVTGADGSIGGDIETFEALVRLSSGSAPMNLNNTVIVFDTTVNSSSMMYNGTADAADSGTAVDVSHFNVYYVFRGSEYLSGFLSRGDLVKLKFRCPTCSASTTTGGLLDNRRATIKIIPRVGTPEVISFVTPDGITTKNVPLWP
jgi:archaeal flagellin FlaB